MKFKKDRTEAHSTDLLAFKEKPINFQLDLKGKVLPKVFLTNNHSYQLKWLISQ